jgi:hypothetical protein
MTHIDSRDPQIENDIAMRMRRRDGSAGFQPRGAFSRRARRPLAGVSRVPGRVDQLIAEESSGKSE